MKHTQALLCAAGIGIMTIFSCKKDSKTPTPTTTTKTDTLSKRYLPGWWSVQNYNYTSVYFGADSFFYQSIPQQAEQTGKWWWSGTDSIQVRITGRNSLSVNDSAGFTLIWTVSRLRSDSLYLIPGAGSNTVTCSRKDSAGFTSPVLTTLAGSYFAGGAGDNGPAVTAQLNQPADVALDKAGNIFIADYGNTLIRKITVSTGVISTVAGQFSGPYSDMDSMPATGTLIGSPYGVAFDRNGDFYIADFFIDVLRKVSVSSGIMTIIAGDATVTSTSSSVQPGYYGDSLPGRKTKLRGPLKLAVDTAGNVYFCDGNNYRVRRLDRASGLVVNVAGTGVSTYNGDGIAATTAALYYPNGLAIDKNGNIFVADYNRIRRIDAHTGLISTVAGTGTAGFSGDGGQATAAQINSISGVAVDGSGNIYFCDAGNNRIRKISAADGTISTIAGNGIAGFSGDGMHATAMRLNQPTGIATDAAGNVYFAEFKNNRVRKLTFQ